MHPFLEALFCESKLRRITELEGIESNLMDALGEKEQEITNAEYLIEGWKLDYINLQHSSGVALSLVKTQLAQALQDSIKIPDIKFETATNTDYDPWGDVNLDGYSLRAIADRKYLTYSFNDWIEILNKCFGSASKAQEKWKKEVGDCDNWAEAVHYIVTNATLRAGLPSQSAIAIAWSNTHAYNLFIDSDGGYWIYEPQNNKLIGRLGETTGMYETTRIFFIG